MKSKSTIQKEITTNINLTWENNNPENPNPLVQLMLEETSQELFYANNAIDNMGQSILNRLVKQLVPINYNYIRPACGILHVHPPQPVAVVDRRKSFVLKEVPHSLKDKGISGISFTSVVNTKLTDVKITHLFHNRTLYEITPSGEKKHLADFEKGDTHNKIRIGLDIHPEIDNLKNLSFYLDFEHLPDHHVYYDILPETSWKTNGQTLSMNPGFFIDETNTVNDMEKDILHFYRDHFQTINDNINPHHLKKEQFPSEISNEINEALPPTLPFLLWISIDFPAVFDRKHLSKIKIRTNAFPIVNRMLNKSSMLKKDLRNSTPLSVGTNQVFSEIHEVIDSKRRIYIQEDDLNEQGTYRIFQKKREDNTSPKLFDYLERLSDIIHEKKAAFPEIYKQKISNVLNNRTIFKNNNEHLPSNNRLKDSSGVTVIEINSKEDVSSVDVLYWTSHVELIPHIPEGTTLLTNKIPELNKTEATLISPTTMGRDFRKLQNLKSINRFFLTSKGRILTKNDILNFCRLELEPFFEDFDVAKKPYISSNRKDGIITVMEIKIKPLPEYTDYFMQKNVLKDLLVRLRRISPVNFNYRINVITNCKF